MNELKATALALEEQNGKSEATIKELEQTLRDKENKDDKIIRDLEKKLRDKSAQKEKLKDFRDQIAVLTAQNIKLAEEIDYIRKDQIDKDEKAKELEKTADELVKVHIHQHRQATSLVNTALPVSGIREREAQGR